MSASVLARSYNDTPTGQQLLLPSASGSRSSRPASVQRPSVSSMKGERVKAGGQSTNGMRISFATDTSFHERLLRSRKSSRSSSTSLNLRIVQGSERPSKVRIRIPKATTATGMRRPSASHDEYLNPRKAMEIARSYGIPKYFLRSNSQQILTDGRMRLFGDSIWKKERTSLDYDRHTIDSSDVISRLMESVNKAIETSQKTKNTTECDESGVQLDVISLKSGFDDQSTAEKSQQKEKESEVSSIDTNSARTDTKSTNMPEGLPKTINDLAVPRIENSIGYPNQSLRPHTVDTGVSLTGYLPKVTFKETDVFINRAENAISSNTGGIRLKHLASPFRGVSDLSTGPDKSKQIGDKYQNVLPRFYPAVSAHRSRQAEAEKSTQRSKKKSGANRLVRFADAHTVRFANDTEKKDQDCLAGVVVRRAPTQSIQRALDSHSCLYPIDKSKMKIKDIQESDKEESYMQANESNNLTLEDTDGEE